MNPLEVTPKWFLSALLPYDSSTKMNGSLKTSLKEYRLLLTAMEQAMTAIQGGDLEQFDALVGENACQIRTIKIAMTAQKYFDSIPSIRAQIAYSKLKMDSLSESLMPLMASGMSLKQVLEREKIDVALTPDEMFLVESFLLSVAKTVKSAKASSPLCRNDAVDFKKLHQFGQDVSASFMDSLVKKARKLLSAGSVAFVRAQAALLKDKHLEKMCSEDFTVNYNKSPCTPMFWTYKILLLTAQNKGIPLVIYSKFLAKDEDYRIVGEDCLFFPSIAHRKGFSYEEAVPYPEDLSKAAIVVQGVACANRHALPSKRQWREAINAQKLDVILAGAADHRQYPNPEEDRRIDALNDGEFEGYKAMARIKGYALENPSLFFIQHVYPATVGNIPLLTQKAQLAQEVMGAFLPERSLAEWPQRAVTQIMSYLEKEGSP